MDEDGEPRRQRRRRRPMIFLCFALIFWVRVRDVLAFHSNLHRRVATSNKGFDCANPYGANQEYHRKRQHGIEAALVSRSNEREVEIPATPKDTAPPPFDTRKIPSISDNTPCEVIHSFLRRDSNDDDDNNNNNDTTTTSFRDVDDVPEEEAFYFPSPEELAALPKGDRGGYHIVRQYTIDETSWNQITNGNSNCTLQDALAGLDPENYPTLTRARKACRKGMVLVHRNCVNKDGILNNTHESMNPEEPSFRRGNVGDRVSPGDVIGVQVFLGTYRKKQCYPKIDYSRPQFQLPVLYEDDHLAVVHKPAGIAVYSDTRTNRKGDQTGNRRTVHFALPFVLTPPRKGTPGGILRRPGMVHRIDKPTSGLLVVAKTKAAMDQLYKQFRTRQIQKIYTAIVNGDLMPQVQEHDKENHHDDDWNLIDYPLGGKHALTSWKILQRAPSLNARDGVLTMIQVRLHTGRYHQIRRHFAWWCRRPLVGDHLYAGLLQAHHFRKKGLFLSANGISFVHPMIQTENNENGNEEWRRVEITIDVPKRFDKLMKAEESWAVHNSKNE